MRLLEFHYWSDIVMAASLFCVLGVSIIIVLMFKVLSNASGENPGGTNKQRKKLMQKLDKIIEQVKRTV